MRKALSTFEHKKLSKLALSVAHMALFYGMDKDANVIFDWCENDLSQTREAVVCGRALRLLVRRDYDEAAVLLEEASKHIKSDIIKAFLVTVCMRSKSAERRKRAISLIADIRERLPVEDPAHALVDIADGGSSVVH